jgi:hypothetical protein
MSTNPEIARRKLDNRINIIERDITKTDSILGKNTTTLDEWMKNIKH